MAVDIKKYVEGLAQEAGLPKEQASAFLQALENEKFAKPLADGILRHEDYSRNSDSLRKEKETFERTQKEWKDWYTDVLKTKESNERVVAEANAKLQAYVNTYGELDGSRVVASPVDTGTMEKKYQEMLEKQGKQALYVIKKATWAAADYMKRFNDVLDLDAVEKIAVEKNLSVEQAYQEYIKPKVTEMDTKAMEAKIAAAKEEGRKEALSGVNLPIDNGPKAHHTFFDRAKEAPGGRKLSEGFAQAWQEAASSKT